MRTGRAYDSDGPLLKGLENSYESISFSSCFVFFCSTVHSDTVQAVLRFRAQRREEDALLQRDQCFHRRGTLHRRRPGYVHRSCVALRFVQLRGGTVQERVESSSLIDYLNGAAKSSLMTFVIC